MGKLLLYSTAVMVATISMQTIPAAAQLAPTAENATSVPAVANPQAKKKSSSGAIAKSKAKNKSSSSEGGIIGNWTGELTQVDAPMPHKFEISIEGTRGETRYPDLDCVGKLTRVASSKSYVFFLELITHGRAEQGGRCPDGTLTLARTGDSLAVGWFGSVQNTTIVAYGTLARR